MQGTDQSDLGSGALAGVVAHGLLNTIAVISGAAELLRTEWETLSAPRRSQLLELIEVHSAEAAQGLVSIVQGLPHEALAVLDELSRQRDAPRTDPPPRLRRRASDPDAVV